MYTAEPRSLNEYGDSWEFVVYGEERCAELGIEDDAEMADFLFQAFDGEVMIWYKQLPEQVQTSWFALKIALMEQFAEGSVMRTLHKLFEEPWQVPHFEGSFNLVWRVYCRFSFFREDFLMCLKSDLLKSVDQVCLKQVKPQGVQEIVEDAGEVMLYAYEQEVEAIEEPCKQVEESRMDMQSEILAYDASCEELSCFSCKDEDMYEESIDKGSSIAGELEEIYHIGVLKEMLIQELLKNVANVASPKGSSCDEAGVEEVHVDAVLTGESPKVLKDEAVNAWLQQFSDEERVQSWMEQLNEDCGMEILENWQPDLDFEEQPMKDKGLGMINADEGMFFEAFNEGQLDVHATQKQVALGSVIWDEEKPEDRLESLKLEPQEGEEVVSYASYESFVDVEDMQVEETIPSEQKLEFPDHSVMEEMDPELEAILDDALPGFACVNGVNVLPTLHRFKVKVCDAMEETGERELVKTFPSMDKVEFEGGGQVPHVESCLKGDVVIKEWCSNVLMQVLLKEAMKQVLHERWSLLSASFCHVFSLKEVDANEDVHVVWAHDEDGKVEDTTHGLQKNLVFDPGGWGSLYVADWATSL